MKRLDPYANSDDLDPADIGGDWTPSARVEAPLIERRLAKKDGMIWVKPTYRGGKPVKGYWRKSGKASAKTMVKPLSEVVFDKDRFLAAVGEGRPVRLAGVHGSMNQDVVEQGFRQGVHGGGYFGAGTYFNVLDPSGADAHDRVYRIRPHKIMAEVTLNKPLVIQSHDRMGQNQSWDLEQIARAAYEGEPVNVEMKVRDFVVAGSYDKRLQKGILKRLQAKGYDGIVYISDANEMGIEHGSQIIVFDAPSSVRITEHNLDDEKWWSLKDKVDLSGDTAYAADYWAQQARARFTPNDTTDRNGDPVDMPAWGKDALFTSPELTAARNLTEFSKVWDEMWNNVKNLGLNELARKMGNTTYPDAYRWFGSARLAKLDNTIETFDGSGFTLVPWEALFATPITKVDPVSPKDALNAITSVSPRTLMEKADAVATKNMRAMGQAVRHTLDYLIQTPGMNELISAWSKGDFTDWNVKLARVAHAAHVRPERLAKAMQDTFMDGAYVPHASALMPLHWNPDAITPQAVRYANSRSAELVTNVSADMEKNIRMYVAQTVQGDMDVSELKRTLSWVVKLSDADAARVETMRQGLLKGGATKVHANGQAREYADRLLANRADLIAQTETMTAMNAGVYDYWTYLAQAGRINPATLKWQWVTDHNPCPTCSYLDGTEIDFTDQFSLPAGQFLQHPPVHPRCRCTLRLWAPDISQAILRAGH